MKKGLLILFLSAYSLFAFSDTIYSGNENDISFFLTKKYQNLNDKIIQFDKEKAELNQKIISVQNENDKRVTVLMWAIGIMTTLLIVIAGGTAWKNSIDTKRAIVDTIGIAKDQADKEITILLKEKYETKLQSISNNIVDTENVIAELQTEIETIQSTIKTLKIKLS